MQTTLLGKLKNALAEGELNSDVRGDVLVKMLNIITDNDSCKLGLGTDQLLDAAEYALKLFLVGWKNFVTNANNEAELHRKLYVLCLNACQIERRRTGRF